LKKDQEEERALVVLNEGEGRERREPLRFFEVGGPQNPNLIGVARPDKDLLQLEINWRISCYGIWPLMKSNGKKSVSRFCVIEAQ
jgi:hypothetical protein